MEQTLNFDFSLLNQGYAQTDGDWNFGPICSSFSRIYYVTEGTGSVIFGDRDHLLTPGHLYLIPALMSHYDRCDGRFSHYYIHCIDQTQQTIHWYRQLQLPFELDATEADVLCIRRLNEICPDIPLADAQPDTYDNSSNLLQCSRRFMALPMGVRMEVNGLLLQLLSRFFAHATVRHNVNDNRIIQTLYTIGQHLADTPSIEQLSREVSLTKDAFIRLFRRQTGQTPTDYIIRQRVQHAQMQFISGKRSVKQVALSLGYENVSYFGRLFKKVTDVSPMEFIRQNR